MHKTADVKWVDWYENYASGTERRPVAEWKNGVHRDAGQWQGRTNITSAEGDITINNLILEDDGIYSCLASDINGLPPYIGGAEYNLKITGTTYDNSIYSSLHTDDNLFVPVEIQCRPNVIKFVCQVICPARFRSAAPHMYKYNTMFCSSE